MMHKRFELHTRDDFLRQETLCEDAGHRALSDVLIKRILLTDVRPDLRRPPREAIIRNGNNTLFPFERRQSPWSRLGAPALREETVPAVRIPLVLPPTDAALGEFEYICRRFNGDCLVKDRTEDVPPFLCLRMFIEERLELRCVEDALESSDLGDTVAGTHGERGKEWGAKSILPCSCAWSDDNDAVAPRRLSASLRAFSGPSSSQGRTGHMFLARFNCFGCGVVDRVLK